MLCCLLVAAVGAAVTVAATVAAVVVVGHTCMSNFTELLAPVTVGNRTLRLRLARHSWVCYRQHRHHC